MNYWLLLIPLLSAFTGWFTLWLAFKVLFHPRKPHRFLGLKIQGIYPARRDQLAEQLGQLVSREFLSFDKIEQKISDPAAFEKVMPMIEDHVDDFLRNKLKEQMPMISMFIGDKTINSLKTVFMNEIAALFPQVMTQFAGTLKNEFDVEQLVVSKIKQMPAEKLEGMLNQGLAKEFRLAGWAGALVGLLIGLVQIIVILLNT